MDKKEAVIPISERGQSGYKRVTTMILVLVSFYMCCWTPYWLSVFLSVYGVLFPRGTLVLRVVYNIFHMLPYLNCALNPFLYGFLTENFKGVLRQSCLVEKIISVRQNPIREEQIEAVPLEQHRITEEQGNDDIEL